MSKLRLVLLVGLLTTALHGRTSVVVTSGTPTVTLPSGAPWNTIGKNSSPSRWEFRLHGITALQRYAFGLPPLQGGLINGSLYLTYGQNPPAADTYSTSPGPIACCGSGTDVMIRVQRDTANAQITLEVCTTQTGICSSNIQPITTAGQATSWAGWQFYLASGYSMGFMRWYSTAVPVGQPILLAGTKGDLADWEFQNSLVDSVHGLTFTGGSVSYQTTPTYPPSCNAGAQQAFRAGFPAQLDGTGSMPLDGGSTLSYLWQQLPGVSPSNLQWTSHTAAQPQISAIIAGSYNFQLTVTDTSGSSTSCVVHDGAAATDDNAVVVTENPAVDQLLGQMIQFGRNPWPWMDDRDRALAAAQMSNIDNYYLPFWDPPAAGTISVTAGSTLITGVGTHFTTDICGKNGNPSLPQDNMVIFAHWNGGQNRRAIQVASCTDDTHVVAQTAGGDYTWNPPPGYPQSESGLQYSLDATYWLIWQAGNNAQFPANYYDNVAGFYTLYYRTGIDVYLTYARKLADMFWHCPMVDQGASWVINNGSQWAYPGRAMSIIGLILRALDTADGHPDMWAGLHQIWDHDLYFTTWPNVFSPYGVGDEREAGYGAMRTALCGMYDPSSTYRANCKAAIVQGLTSTWSTVRNFYNTAYYPQWQLTPLVSYGNGNSTYVNATKGSSTITLNSLNGATWSSALMPGMIWMWPCVNPGPIDGCGLPAGNSGGDPNYYYVAYQDATHAVLTDVNGNPVAYNGATGPKGISFNGPYSGPNATVIGLGWGMQPFMQGIIAAGLDLEAQAMYDRNYDPASGALLDQYAGEAIQWLASYGLLPAAKGMYYFVGHVNCPVGNEGPYCGIPDPANPSPFRILNAEAVRGAMFTWFHAGRQDSVRDFVDLMVNAAWAKPGTCPQGSTLCVSDGHYVDGYDDGQPWVTGTPPYGANPKWFGMSFGLNPTASWPAMRLGGALPPKNQKVNIGFKSDAVPGATHVKVSTTTPTGRVFDTECTGSPCQVTVDAGKGEHLFRLTYLSNDNTVLATQPAVVRSRQ
jgi:hypothetical protein